ATEFFLSLSIMGQSGHSQPTATGAGASSGFRLSKEPVIPRKKETAGAASPPDYPASYAAYEELGSLPPGYGSRSLYLVARDPHWLFCYWDIDWTEYEAHRQAGGKVHLRLFTPVGEEVHCEEITPDARNWFIPVARGNSVFYGELGFYDAEGQWEVIARSPHAATPPDSVSEPSEDLFATVPYHLAFQKLLELVKTAMSEGESLIDAL